MTPAAHLSAAIEILQQINKNKAPLSEILKAWGRNHRFAGSKDRQKISDIVYQIVRHYPALSWSTNSNDPRIILFRHLYETNESIETLKALCASTPYAPTALTDDEIKAITYTRTESKPQWAQGGYPEQLAKIIEESLENPVAQIQALMQRAPTDIRVNNKCDRRQLCSELQTLLPNAHIVITPYSKRGLRIDQTGKQSDITALDAFKRGDIEIQDEASQLAAFLSNAKPGQTVIDLCAGGGGKTLALASMMNNQGRLIATDINAKRLEAISPRLKRAGLEAELIHHTGKDDELAHLKKAADIVIIDAPCSGSGTWRRHPEAALRLTLEEIEQYALTQTRIVNQAIELLKPQGKLLYMTCSIFKKENEERARHISQMLQPYSMDEALQEAALLNNITVEATRELKQNSAKSQENALKLTPLTTKTDGFYISIFKNT